MKPTFDSIASAKAYQQQERAHVTAVTGLRFDGPRVVVAECPQCGLMIGADSYGQALRQLAKHIVSVHSGPVLQEIAS